MGRNFVFSDIHGNYNLFKQIQDYLGQDDICYGIGDYVDRGSDGIKILQGMRKDARFKPSLGNHEAMMYDACREWEMGCSSFLPLWVDEDNGGAMTFDAYQKLEENERFCLLRYIEKMPRRHKYINTNGNILQLVHAGYSPGISDEDEDDLLWSRSHFFDPWRGRFDEFVIHGHTASFHPTYFDNEEVKAFQYCEGHKINLDIATYYTNEVALFDLDTFEVLYFRE